MKTKRSTRARTSPLMFAPLLLGTIAGSAVRPARVLASDYAREGTLARGRSINRTKY